MKKATVMELHKYLWERSRRMCVKRLSSKSSSSLYKCRLGGTLLTQKEYKREVGSHDLSPYSGKALQWSVLILSSLLEAADYFS